MSDLDSILTRSLDHLVPPPALKPDWDDVLVRAQAAVPLRRDRRVWYALAAAALLTAIVVNPAFGIGGRLLDFFVGEPAPEPVKRELAGMNEVNRGIVIDLLREQGPGILAEQARGLMQVASPVGPLPVWAAPTRTGGLCVFLSFGEVVDGPVGSIYCNRPSKRADLSPDVEITQMRGQRVVLVAGWAKDAIASIELRFSDGTSFPVRMAEHFYVAVLPLEPQLTLVVARTADGKEFARVPTAFLYETAPPEPPPEEGPPARTVIELETAKGVVTLSAAPGAKGVRCWTVAAPDTDAGTCVEGGQPIVAELGQAGSGDQALVLLDGAVTSEVRSLELRFEDGAHVPLRLVEGFFLYEVPPDRWSRGRQPAVLVARDSSGKVIAREPVVPEG